MGTLRDMPLDEVQVNIDDQSVRQETAGRRETTAPPATPNISESSRGAHGKNAKDPVTGERVALTRETLPPFTSRSLSESPLSTGREEQGPSSGVVFATQRGAFGIWRDMVVCLWRQGPSFNDAERLCDVMATVSEQTDSPGLWLVAEPACQVPTAAVRRLVSGRLRRGRALRTFVVSVRGENAEGALMRAALRSTALAGGVRHVHMASDVSAVASHLSGIYPAFNATWGERAVRMLTRATEQIAADSQRLHRVSTPAGVVPDTQG